MHTFSSIISLSISSQKRYRTRCTMSIKQPEYIDLLLAAALIPGLWELKSCVSRKTYMEWFLMTVLILLNHYMNTLHQDHPRLNLKYADFLYKDTECIFIYMVILRKIHVVFIWCWHLKILQRTADGVNNLVGDLAKQCIRKVKS